MSAESYSVIDDLEESLDATLHTIKRYRAENVDTNSWLEKREAFVQSIWSLSHEAINYPELYSPIVELYNNAHQPLHQLGLWGDIRFYYETIGLRAAEGCGQTRAAARFLTYIGVINTNQNDPDQALHYFRRAITLLESLPDDTKAQEDLAAALFHVCSAMNDTGRYHEVINMSQRTITAAEAVGRWDTLGFTLGQVGNAYVRLGDVQQAEATYKQCEVIWEEHPDPHNYIHITYYHLGRLNLLRRNYEQARQYLEKSLSIKQRSGEQKEGVAHCAAQLGIAYAHLGKPEQARANLDIADVITRVELNDARCTAEVMYGYALVETQTGEHDAAFNHLESALEQLSAGHFPDVRFQVSLHMLRLASCTRHLNKIVLPVLTLMQIVRRNPRLIRTGLKLLLHR